MELGLFSQCPKGRARWGATINECHFECWYQPVSESCYRDVRLSSMRHVYNLYSHRLLYTSSFQSFTHHLQTNTIGPIIVAQRMLSIDPTTPLEKIIFISSDSGSASQFRSHEDGFAVYAATKAALNQSLRHMAAEISRKGVRACVLALHPGEVET